MATFSDVLTEFTTRLNRDDLHAGSGEHVPG